MDTLWVHHSARNPAGTATTHLTMRNSGDDDVDLADSISLERREHTKTALYGQSEAFQFGVSNNDDNGSFRVNYFGVKYYDLGEEEEA